MIASRLPSTLRLLLPLCALAVVLVAGPAGAAYVTGDNARTLTHDTKLRDYNLYAPGTYDDLSPAPLIVDLHGASSDKEQQKAISGWNTKADAEGFLVAYPDGIGNTWNAGVCCGGNTEDDVGFLLAMVAAIQAEGNVDANRIYVTGLSNGGAMTHRMVCEAASVFAAAAPLAFPTPYTDFDAQCNPSREIPVLMTMGLTDIVVPYTSGFFGGALESFGHWRTKNGCGAGATEDRFEVGSIHCDIDTTCSNGSQIGLCSVVGIDLAPPLNIFNGHILYLNTDSLVMADPIWEFFETGTITQPGAPVAVPMAGGAGAAALALGLCALGTFRVARRKRSRGALRRRLHDGPRVSRG